MRRAVWLPIGAGAVSGLLLLGATWTVGLVAALPVSVGVGTVVGLLAGWPASKRWLSWASVWTSASSLTATAAALATESPVSMSDGASPFAESVAAGLLGLLEVALLLVLLALVVRAASMRTMVVCVCLLVLADLAWLLRIPPPPTLATGLVTVLVWFAGPLTAAIAGGYPRLAEARRQRTVADARRVQRLRLAQDLHDFVAHDVTGIVVQAQAAQHVGQDDPTVALEALRRIEAAGQHALASIDQALSLIRDGEQPLDPPAAVSAGELRALVDGFAVAGGPAIEVRIDVDAWRLVPPEMAALGHRVLAEALTNVRRHAPATDWVRVNVAARDDELELTVTNPLVEPLQDGRSGGGRGIRQLAALAADGGGCLSAGPAGGDWCLRLIVPLRRTAER